MIALINNIIILLVVAAAVWVALSERAAKS
jgi:hypothetical protein